MATDLLLQPLLVGDIYLAGNLPFHFLLFSFLPTVARSVLLSSLSGVKGNTMMVHGGSRT